MTRQDILFNLVFSFCILFCQVSSRYVELNMSLLIASLLLSFFDYRLRLLHVWRWIGYDNVEAENIPPSL